MQPQVFCQSCSMPIDDVDMRGTEKNGSKSGEYCMYCYANGAFTDPQATLEDMKVIVKTQMEKRHIHEQIIQTALTTLPHLKRWNRMG